jgi:peptide/nickel transport system permease protein
MGAYILRRLALMLPIILGVTFVTFILVNLTGSPVSKALLLNPRIKPEDLKNIERNLGLDKPVGLRYYYWARNLAQGDLGYSLKTGRPVSGTIRAVMPNTLLLSALSVALALAIALPVGILAAVKQNSVFDRVATIGAVAGFAIPTVWLSLMLIILFSSQFREWGLPYLPVGGIRDMRGGGGFFDRVEHLILPVAALAVPQLAGWIVYIRANMLEVIRQDYVRTAEAKGLKARVVLVRHAFRNAVLPLVTLIGLSIPDLFGGALVVENVFAYPGMGRLSITAVNDKDYTMVMATTLLFAILVMIGNLLADVFYVVLDPRIRYH